MAVISNYQRIKPSKKSLINISIDDDECFKWCLVRYLHPADHHAARIAKVDKHFPKRFDFKGIKFALNIRDIHKIEKNNSIAISVSWL